MQAHTWDCRSRLCRASPHVAGVASDPSTAAGDRHDRASDVAPPRVRAYSVRHMQHIMKLTARRHSAWHNGPGVAAPVHEAEGGGAAEHDFEADWVGLIRDLLVAPHGNARCKGGIHRGRGPAAQSLEQTTPATP